MLTLPAPATQREPDLRHRRARWAIAAAALLAITLAASLAIGANPLAPGEVWDALTGQGSAADAAIVLGQRLPRTVLGLAAGIGLGVAGALVQAVTRNPLADPGLLGVTGGSAFLVALAMALGVSAPLGYIWFAFAGALAAAAVVYLLGSGGRSIADPSQLVLAGAALTAVLSGLVWAIRLSDPQRFNDLMVWESGSLEGRGWTVIVPVLPFVTIGLVLAGAIGGKLNILALGDDLAITLGTSPLRVRLTAMAAVTLLAGSATAMAGPIAFVGLMVPHVARWIAGPDQRWILALTAVLAPCLLLGADIAGRVVARPGEVPVGIVVALLGAPMLIALVRRTTVSQL